VGDGVRTLADKVKDTFEQVKGEVTKAAETAKQKADAQAEAAAEATVEAAETVADKAEATAEAAKEIIVEGPSADTISEVFETDSAEEPTPEETGEE